MVKVKIGTLKGPVIDTTLQKCMGCGEEFYYPYYQWVGGCYVRPVCPKCKEPIQYE